MISALVCFLAWLTTRSGGQFVTKTDLPMPSNSLTSLWTVQHLEPLDPLRESPKKFGADKIPWLFPWLVAGFSRNGRNPSADELKFRVYSQEEKGNRAPDVARMLLRLWDLNLKHLNLIHNPQFHLGLVDVFLCFGGQAGGEQLFDHEIGPDKQLYKVNTIYIYDLSSFTDPVEMAREVAHEYGHATWHPIGGFKDPEEWSDGYLAEKVFLRWLRDGLASGDLTTADTMGATKEGLDKWLVAHADPLILSGAQTEPTSPLLADPSAAGMNAFIGLALFLQAAYPDRVFARSIELCGYSAKDYPGAAVLAAEEPLEDVPLKIPPALIGKKIWLPLGTGKLSGAVSLRTNADGWVQVQVGTRPIVIKNAR